MCLQILSIVCSRRIVILKCNFACESEEDVKELI